MIKVLIVEDDPMVSEFNRRYLEQVGGFELIAIAPSVADALHILDHQEIDLILLDIFMPGMNGFDLLAQIRKLGQGVDVIVVSAACDSQSIKKALRYGAVDYLIKPFEFERFKTALSAYREWVSMTKDQEKLSQAELDIRMLHPNPLTVPSELPKGLTRNTLKTVWENIQETKTSSFSTEEMAKRVGISRVSMRKYLSFLTDIGVIEMEVIYGSIGRPIYQHRCLKPESDLIKRYF
ncbi:response regulator [Desulfosporosinus nitroreducens]|uniref:Transcriptional regulatory protein n=1 Tax=Desulfosporosinus nitroreducens TaxID=2018668 RepID=A0ABT8QU27_9FIRM|nr:response regulator [Desulfosporosinus nitroreducens]MCO1601019.1 response regulator [Desulfosporosinus nitroreducens]MDO0824863.1 response regulator [Desulfosporosinus nitroreducens]